MPPADLCAAAADLAARLINGPALTADELAIWWTFREGIATGAIKTYAQDEVAHVEVTVGGHRFWPGTKIDRVLDAIRGHRMPALAAALLGGLAPLLEACRPGF